MSGALLWGIEGVRDQVLRWIPNADLGKVALTSPEHLRLMREERRLRQVRIEGRLEIEALVERQMLYDLWQHAPERPPNQYPEADPLPADYGTIKEFLRRKLDLWENYDRDFPQRPAYGPTDTYVAAARAYVARIAAALEVGGEDERYSRPYRVCKFYSHNRHGEADGEMIDSVCWRRMYPDSTDAVAGVAFEPHQGVEWVNMQSLTWFQARGYTEYCCTGCLEDDQYYYADEDRAVECGRSYNGMGEACTNAMETRAGVWCNGEEGDPELWCGECARDWPEAISVHLNPGLQLD